MNKYLEFLIAFLLTAISLAAVALTVIGIIRSLPPT